MEIFIAIFIIGFVVYLIIKYSNKTANISTPKSTRNVDIPFEIKVVSSNNIRSYSQNEEKFNPIKQVDINSWILNPGASFELTVTNADLNKAQEIRDLLDNEEISDYLKDDKLVEIFASHNLIIKEIEEYKKKYREQYLTKVEELKNTSSEWKMLGEKDREDLLFEFRQIAINSLYERANCELEVIFECEPKDITLDDDLIKEYGFENIKTYLNYVENLDKIRVIPNDNYSRPRFEKLADIGLAKRGNELSKEEVLSTLTLKELNVIANNPEKEYKRKNQAIEYILTFDDLEKKIGNKISLRELFKLNPLPSKYSNLSLQEISKTWRYHSEEVRLLMDTYRNAYYAWTDLQDVTYVKGYKLVPMHKEDPCPCAKERSMKKYSINNPPKVPFHIGCSCMLNKEYN